MTSQPPKRGLRVNAYDRVRLTVAVLTAIIGATVPFFADHSPPDSWLLSLVILTTVAFSALRRIDKIADARRLARAAEDPHEVLRRRIKNVNTALIDAATLTEDLRRDLAAQQAAREELLAQAKERQRLLAVDAEQAEKIRQALIGKTKATIRAERRQQWMFLIIGALVSIPIGVAINLLVP